MNKFKLAKIAADYAYERRSDALTLLHEQKFFKVEAANLTSFLRFCVTAKKDTAIFGQEIRRSYESFNPYFIQIENQRDTILKVYTFNNFKTFWILKADLNNKTKRLLKNWELNIIK